MVQYETRWFLLDSPILSVHSLNIEAIIRGQNKEKTFLVCFFFLSSTSVFSCHDDKTFPHKIIKKNRFGSWFPDCQILIPIMRRQKVEISQPQLWEILSWRDGSLTWNYRDCNTLGGQGSKEGRANVSIYWVDRWSFLLLTTLLPWILRQKFQLGPWVRDHSISHILKGVALFINTLSHAFCYHFTPILFRFLSWLPSTHRNAILFLVVHTHWSVLGPVWTLRSARPGL